MLSRTLFGAGDSCGPQGFQTPHNRKRRLLTHADQAAAQRQALAPDVIDHGMVGGRAGVGAHDASVRDKLFGERDAEHHARREARERFVK